MDLSDTDTPLRGPQESVHALQVIGHFRAFFPPTCHIPLCDIDLDAPTHFLESSRVQIIHQPYDGYQPRGSIGGSLILICTNPQLLDELPHLIHRVLDVLLGKLRNVFSELNLVFRVVKAVFYRERSQIGKPIAQNSVLRLVRDSRSERGGYPAAFCMSDDEDVRHMEVLHRELHRGRRALVVWGKLATAAQRGHGVRREGGLGLLCDIAMDEDIARHGGGNDRLGYARVGAANPEDLEYGRFSVLVRSGTHPVRTSGL